MKIIMSLVAVLVLSAGLSAQEKAPMTGLWKCKLGMPGSGAPDRDGELDLQQTGKDIKGTGSNSGGSAPIKGTFEDGKYKLIVEAGEAPWELTGKIEGAKLNGEFAIAAAGIKGTMTCGKPEAASTTSSKSAATATLTGLWKCTSKVPDQPESPFQLELKQDGENVTGTGTNAAGSAPLKGTIKDGKFQFKIEAGETVFEFEGKLAGSKISGTLNIPVANMKATFEGSKGT